jgi:hypothetical protein
VYLECNPVTRADQIEAIEQRLAGLEVRVDNLDAHIPSINKIEMGYLYAKAALAIIPMIVGVLMFLDWWTEEGVSIHQPPVLVDTVCEYCLYDFADGDWHCVDCVVLEVTE